jgi:hypothetical protein
MDEQADIRARRGKLLNRARDLARSGRYADHRSIFAELETIDDFADAWGRVEAFRSQLDRICALAQQKQSRTRSTQAA